MRYVVQPWETWESLDSIASRFGVTTNELIQANPILNTMPVRPGMVLSIPGYPEPDLPPNGYIEYVVQPGDTIFNVANRYHLNYRRVMSQNPQIPNPDVIWPGQILYLIFNEM